MRAPLTCIRGCLGVASCTGSVAAPCILQIGHYEGVVKPKLPRTDTDVHVRFRIATIFWVPAIFLMPAIFPTIAKIPAAAMA